MSNNFARPVPFGNETVTVVRRVSASGAAPTFTFTKFYGASLHFRRADLPKNTGNADASYAKVRIPVLRNDGSGGGLIDESTDIKPGDIAVRGDVSNVESIASLQNFRILSVTKNLRGVMPHLLLVCG